MRQERRPSDDVDRARHLVEKGELRVAMQQERIVHLMTKGRSTDRAEAFLMTLEHSLQRMRNHLEMLQMLKRL
jgi:hypothetical protein